MAYVGIGRVSGDTVLLDDHLKELKRLPYLGRLREYVQGGRPGAAEGVAVYLLRP